MPYTERTNARPLVSALNTSVENHRQYFYQRYLFLVLCSVVVFASMVALFMEDGWNFICEAIGGALLFYFITVIASCLIAIYFAGPIYVVLAKYNLANYEVIFDSL